MTNRGKIPTILQAIAGGGNNSSNNSNGEISTGGRRGHSRRGGRGGSSGGGRTKQGRITQRGVVRKTPRGSRITRSSTTA